MSSSPSHLSKLELVEKFVSTGILAHKELDFLRQATSRFELEAMAASLSREQQNLSRKLYKLCNRLFPIKKGQKIPAPAAHHPAGMFRLIKEAKPGHGGKKIVTGGGANGTSKRT